MSTFSEKILWVHLDYLYEPALIYDRIIERFNTAIKGSFFVSPIDKLPVPFTLEQVTLFLESCASMMFFLQKNDILKVGPSHDNDVKVNSEVLIEKIIEFGCLRSMLHFAPEASGKGEITLDIDLYELIEGDEEDDKIKDKKRVFKLECSSGPYTLEEITDLKYYPRSVGYSEEQKELRLERFKLSKELKLESYPLYVNMPYVQEYVNHCLRRPKDHQAFT